MAKQSGIGLDVNLNADGYDAAGGTTKRKLVVTGADITLAGSGTNVYTFQNASHTVASTAKTWSDVTGSRAFGTNYANSSSTAALMVMVTVRCTITVAGGNSQIQAKSDASNPSTTAASGIVGIEAGLLNEDNTFQLVFVVAAGARYNVDATAANGNYTLGKWFEMPF